jgi:hypothetical protein
MGFVSEESASKIIPIADMHFISGTWTVVVASNIWSMNKTAITDSPTIHIPVIPPVQDIKALNQVGCQVNSIDIWYFVGTAALTSLAAAIYRLQLPDNQVALPAVIAQAFAYDAGHAAAGGRITFDAAKVHKMTLTPTVPLFLGNGDILDVELAVAAAGTSVLKIYDAQVNYTLRL